MHCYLCSLNGYVAFPGSVGEWSAMKVDYAGFWGSYSHSGKRASIQHDQAESRGFESQVYITPV